MSRTCLEPPGELLRVRFGGQCKADTCLVFPDGGLAILGEFLRRREVSSPTEVWQSARLFAGTGVLGTLYGLGERALRRRKTRYMARRIQKLEKQLDPKRSSSELQVTGATREEDHP